MSIGDYCSKPAVTIHEKETVRVAAQRMSLEGLGCLALVHGERPVGIATDRDLALETLARRLDPGSVTVGEVASRSLVTVAADAPVREAIRCIRRHGVRRLPVVNDEGKLVGIVAADDLVTLVASELNGLVVAIRGQAPRREMEAGESPAQPTPLARHYRKEVAAISSDATAREAAEAMRARAVGSLVVTKDGTPVGIATDRDLLVRVVAGGLDAGATAVSDVMSQPLQVASPGDALDRIVELMSAQGVRRVPVVEDGALVGIVALDDVLAALADELHDLASGMRRELSTALRGARARELTRDAVDGALKLGEQLESFGVETRNRVVREFERVRERFRT